jgi:hypothetical protein
VSDEEHLGLVELAVRERPAGVSIIAGAGSNDTRHAVHLTERACELGVDAVLSVTPYYNRPSRRGILRHFEEVARASSVPVVLYNIPQRTGTDMPNDLLAELAQIERIDYVKQANDNNLAPVDGLRVYAGNDGTFARTLDMGEPAASSSPATSSARRCGAWSTSPTTAPRSTPRCATSTRRSSSPPARPARRPRSSCSATASAACDCRWSRPTSRARSGARDARPPRAAGAADGV